MDETGDLVPDFAADNDEPPPVEPDGEDLLQRIDAAEAALHAATTWEERRYYLLVRTHLERRWQASCLADRLARIEERLACLERAAEGGE